MICSNCTINKPPSEYYYRKSDRSQKAVKMCKQCSKEAKAEQRREKKLHSDDPLYAYFN